MYKVEDLGERSKAKPPSFWVEKNRRRKKSRQGKQHSLVCMYCICNVLHVVLCAQGGNKKNKNKKTVAGLF